MLFYFKLPLVSHVHRAQGYYFNPSTKFLYVSQCRDLLIHVGVISFDNHICFLHNQSVKCMVCTDFNDCYIENNE